MKCSIYLPRRTKLRVLNIRIHHSWLHVRMYTKPTLCYECYHATYIEKDSGLYMCCGVQRNCYTQYDQLLASYCRLSVCDAVHYG